MIRPACYRVLALVPLTVLGMTGDVARAEQSEPAPSPGQADQKTAPSPERAPLNEASSSLIRANDPVKPVRGAHVGRPQVGQTPAQQRYGLPKNPIVGPPVDTDLTKTLTLERAIRIGLQYQNSIAIAQTQTEAASARLVQARSAYYPQITPSYQYQSSLTPGQSFTFNGAGTGGSTTNGSFSSETTTSVILARQLIFDTGKREANVGASRRNLFAAEYTVGDERQSVVLNVTANYYNVLRDRELVRVQEESVRRAQTTLESIQAQVEAGAAAQSDTLQAESDLANARVSLLQAQNDFNVQQASLKNAMGVVSPQPLILPEEKAGPPTPQPDATNLEQYVQTAYATRLDVKAQQERINAQGYQVRIAHINNGVTVEADITEGYQIDPNSGEERDFLVSFSYPLFNGGNTRAAVREAKANLEQERRALDQLQQNVRFSVAQSYLTREQARQSITAAQTAVDAGQLNYNAALEKQRNGLINILDVINAEVQLINAQVALVNSIYNFYIADAQLRRDIGLNDTEYVPNVPGARPAGTQVPQRPSPSPAALTAAMPVSTTTTPGETGGRKP